MPRTYCFQYEFSAEIAASAAAVFIQKPKHKLDAKFWKGFASLVGLTALGGLGVLLSMTLEVDAPVLVAPLIFLGVFGSLLVIVLSLHLFAWAMGGVYPLIRWKARRLMMKQFRDLDDRTVRWVFTDEKFEVHMVNHDREVTWDRLQQLRIYREFWMLVLKGGPNLLLPEVHLSPDLKNLIRRKAIEVEAKILEIA